MSSYTVYCLCISILYIIYVLCILCVCLSWFACVSLVFTVFVYCVHWEIQLLSVVLLQGSSGLKHELSYSRCVHNTVVWDCWPHCVFFFFLKWLLSCTEACTAHMCVFVSPGEPVSWNPMGAVDEKQDIKLLWPNFHKIDGKCELSCIYWVTFFVGKWDYSAHFLILWIRFFTIK